MTIENWRKLRLSQDTKTPQSAAERMRAYRRRRRRGFRCVVTAAPICRRLKSMLADGIL
jgi:hypothetical protein